MDEGFLLSPSDKTEGEEFTEFELLEKTFPEGDVKLQMFHSVCFVFLQQKWKLTGQIWILMVRPDIQLYSLFKK